LTCGGGKVAANEKLINYNDLDLACLLAQLSNGRFGGMIRRQRAGQSDRKPLTISHGKDGDLDIPGAC